MENTDNVTPIRPPGSSGPSKRRRPKRARPPKLRDMEAAIDEQRFRLWESAAIIESVAIALSKHFFDGDWPAGVPEFHRALGATVRVLADVADQLEMPCLEDRGQRLAGEAPHGYSMLDAVGRLGSEMTAAAQRVQSTGVQCCEENADG